MSPPVSDTRIQAVPLRAFGEAILTRLGVPPDDAAITIESLVEADLRGVHSHGVQRLLWYAGRLESNATNPRPKVRVIESSGGTAVVNGDGGLGQVVSHHAMCLAIELAKTNGVAVVSVRDSHHFGTCAFWAQMALPHGMIGIAMTNGGPVMAPWGGLTRTTGNNPIGVAIPAGRELPIVLDMATTILAGGMLDLAARKGEKIPLGSALDSDGNPTEDPVEARKGLLLPIGGHKGYGLTIVFEALTGLLAGANFARQVPEAFANNVRMNVGHYFQAIDIARYMPLSSFQSRVDELIQQIKSSRRAPGTDRILLPGELEHGRRAASLAHGIPLAGSVIAELQGLSDRLGIQQLRLSCA